MMTDSEIRTMKDSVPTMTVDQAAALPIYDSIRGTVASGMAAERYFALLDGAKPSGQTDAQARSDAHYDHMASRLDNAWKEQPAVNDNHAARDGRSMVADAEQARRDMISRQSDAWKK